MKDEPKQSKPRINNKLKKEIDLSIGKIQNIIRHIKNVQDNCILLGHRLIERGEIHLGKTIIARGLVHDNSKFFGAEWDNMNAIPINSIDADPTKLKRNISINHHRQTNDHHPEYWGSILNMPESALAEAICDWKSRSEEFGTDFRKWIDEYATENWGFEKTDDVYKKIMRFVDLLCEKPFEEIK
jgi:hypothetical protein